MSDPGALVDELCRSTRIGLFGFCSNDHVLLRHNPTTRCQGTESPNRPHEVPHRNPFPSARHGVRWQATHRWLRAPPPRLSAGGCCCCCCWAVGRPPGRSDAPLGPRNSWLGVRDIARIGPSTRSTLRGGTGSMRLISSMRCTLSYGVCLMGSKVRSLAYRVGSPGLP